MDLPIRAMEKEMSQEDQTDAETQVLDPDGDVILVVEGELSSRKFKVSSQILGSASPVFKTLFHGGFNEGARLEQKTCPEITLQDDDTDAMNMILNIIHHNPPDIKAAIDPELVALIAISCDKYDCIKTFQAWGQVWLSTDHTKGADSYGLLLLAAHYFRAEDAFSKISHEATTQLKPHFDSVWNESKFMGLLPRHVARMQRKKRQIRPLANGETGDLKKNIISLQKELHQSIHSIKRSLTIPKRVNGLQSKLCHGCGRIQSSIATKCSFCYSPNLGSRHCTTEFRVALYVEMLEQTGVWPSLYIVEGICASDLASRIKNTRNTEGGRGHDCTAPSCPLDANITALLKDTDEIMNRVKGLCLYPLHQCLND